MDVLAGRKTGGLITGDIRVDGHPKNQETFARVAGYCEQVLILGPCPPRVAAIYLLPSKVAFQVCNWLSGQLLW